MKYFKKNLDFKPLRYNHTHTHTNTHLKMHFFPILEHCDNDDGRRRSMRKGLLNLIQQFSYEEDINCTVWRIGCCAVFCGLFFLLYIFFLLFFALIFFTKKNDFFKLSHSFFFCLKPWNNNLLCLFSFSCSSSILFSRNIIINM